MAGLTLWDPRASMASHGEAHLRALAGAVGHADVASACGVYHDMVRHWGGTPLDAGAFSSKLTLDKSPLEFSVNVGPGGGRLRWVVDCTAERGDGAAAREVGLDVCGRVAALGADLSRFDVVRRFFLPESPTPDPMGVGVDFVRSGALFKAYFRLRPFDDADERCCAALEALGMRAQAAFVGDFLRGQNVHCKLVGVDLTPGAGARVKVYFRCAGSALRETASRLVAACGEGAEKLALFEHFATTLSGLEPSRVERASGRLKMAVQFVEGRETPVDFTPYYWLFSGLDDAEEGDDDEGLDDESVSKRVVALFARHGLPEGPYLRALGAFARVPLRDEYLIHTYVGFQGQPGKTSISAYLNPRFNAYRLEPEEW